MAARPFGLQKAGVLFTASRDFLQLPEVLPMAGQPELSTARTLE